MYVMIEQKDKSDRIGIRELLSGEQNTRVEPGSTAIVANMGWVF